jgi:prepilin-type N-terminal cleavage/methylation domain-containing protein
VKPRAPRDGFTLVELAITVLVLATVMGLPAMLLSSSWQTYRNGSANGGLDERARATVERITGLLEQASATKAGPVTGIPFHTPWTEFERVSGHQVGGMPVWTNKERILIEYTAADPDDGVDNDGDGRVDECRVVWIEDYNMVSERRTVLSNEVAEWMEGEVSGNLVDDNGNGLIDERGLAFTFSGERVSVHLTVERTEPGRAVPRRRTVTRTVAFRNQGP